MRNAKFAGSRRLEGLRSLSTIFLLLVASVVLFGDVVWDARLKEKTDDLWTFSPQVGVEFFREIGFAFFIAWVVATTVERSSREKQELAAEEMQNEIADNVFRGVYRNSLPKQMVDAFTNNLLSLTFMRDYVELTYDLRQETKDGRSFVVIKGDVEYSVRNVSRRPQTFQVELGIDVSNDELLRSYAGLHSIKVRGIDSVRDFKNQNNVLHGTIEYSKTIEIQPEESVLIRFSYENAKNSSDTLIWSTTYPTLRLSMKVVMNLPDRKLSAHALYHPKFTQIFGSGHEGLNEWALNDVVLPNQGVVLFWQPRHEELHQHSSLTSQISSPTQAGTAISHTSG